MPEGKAESQGSGLDRASQTASLHSTETEMSIQEETHKYK